VKTEKSLDHIKHSFRKLMLNPGGLLSGMDWIDITKSAPLAAVTLPH
jgi:hypothetical protein